MSKGILSKPNDDDIPFCYNCLLFQGLIHEMKAEFPASEVVYRSVLQIVPGHSTALERLGRVYLRYRETIPAAVQCFFKSVETNPSNHVAWYLLGRCYMATSQYSDACEAYNRAVNLNPNDPQVWCSLGVLYYAFGQYREALGMLARALKLDATMADAWYNVGALYDMCNQPEDAQKAYLKAKENGLADRFARAGLGLNPLSMQSLQFTDNSEYEHSDGNGIGQQNSGYGRNHRPSGNSSHQNSNNQTNAELVSNSGNLSFHPPHTTESSSHNIQQSSNNSSNSSHISQQQWSHNQQHQEPRQLQSEHQSSSHLEEHLHQHLRQVQSLSPLQHDSGYIAYGNDDLYQQHQGQALAQALEDLVRDDDSGERGR